MLKQGMEAGHFIECAKLLADPSLVTNTSKVLGTDEIITIKRALEDQIRLRKQVQTHQTEPESLNFILEGEAVVYNCKGKNNSDGV